MPKIPVEKLQKTAQRKDTSLCNKCGVHYAWCRSDRNECYWCHNNLKEGSKSCDAKPAVTGSEGRVTKKGNTTEGKGPNRPPRGNS